jgi:hypothetical protein
MSASTNANANRWVLLGADTGSGTGAGVEAGIYKKEESASRFLIDIQEPRE